LTKEPYSRDPRNIARKAESYLASTGIGDTAYFAPEAEFYMFDDVRFETKQQTGYYAIDSIAGAWNTGRIEDGGNRGYKVRYKGWLLPRSAGRPLRRSSRRLMTKNLEDFGADRRAGPPRGRHCRSSGINYRSHHAERRRRPAEVQVHRSRTPPGPAGKTATFMPSRSSATTAPACTCTPPSGTRAARCSTTRPATAAFPKSARWYIGGILEHAPSLLAFTNPTVNSYHRLVPGFEAPVNLVYSSRNRSAAMRIPITGSNPKAKRVEFRCPDPSSNPYLAFAAILLAGVDGILNKTEPAAPIDKDLYELPPEEHASVQTVPDSLDGVLDNLEADHDYLLAGDVFTPDLIETWIELKREDIDAVRLRPTPHEFELYYDV
jgi:glutamine synthetase